MNSVYSLDRFPVTLEEGIFAQLHISVGKAERSKAAIEK